MNNTALTVTALKLRGLLAAGTLLVATAGCSVELGESTEGDRGRVEFAYTGSSCLFGCALDRPLLAGTEATISVEGGGASSADVRAHSTDESVVTVTVRHDCSCTRDRGDAVEGWPKPEGESCPSGSKESCVNTVHVQTQGPGSADLELYRGDGRFIDRATLRVAEAASLRVDGGEMQLSEELTLSVGDEVTLRATPYDARGRELFATTGISWAVEGAAAELSDSWFYLGDLSRQLSARAVGTATVTLSAGNVSRRLAVYVAPSR